MQNYDKKSHRKQDSEDFAVGTFYYRKNYFSTPKICLKLHRALGNCPDPFISDEVCCYLQLLHQCKKYWPGKPPAFTLNIQGHEHSYSATGNEL